ncbi:MAG: Uma2 family endonuclease [Leptolyngbyaceae cyanobacterium SM1_1_3]|nr:Uma2 family endonuclease [Leptolyngbyaceae cyanobacterium SM1_1_3]NJN01454.1 Uma2 family endonuclease [Leptolyngbyaceae cyanobacterium RM1_1_2]
MVGVASNQLASVVYPSSDGKPVAETFAHLYALLVTLEILKQYLAGQRATVLANQFLYYAQGFPRLRVAPDVMVIFNVESGGRDSYKIWQEGEVPSVIFEMTSQSTKSQDTEFKRVLYAQMGVQEYWLFDPKGEWLDVQLQGYCLQGEGYEAIAHSCSSVLQLRLQAEAELIGFYRLDTGEKLLPPAELATARQQAEARAAEAEAQVARLQEKLRSLGIDLDE